MRVVLGVVRGLVAWTAGLLAVAVVVLAALGWRPVLLVSGSMTPYAPAGAIVVASPVAGVDVEVGDVITAQSAQAALPVTHRVVAMTEEGDGTLLATLQGDANDEPDPGQVRLDGRTLLRARWVVEGGGDLIGRNASRMLVGLATIVGGLLGLIWVWLPPLRDTPRPVGVTIGQR